MQDVTKALATLFVSFYGENLSPEQVTAKMFADTDTQRRAASWLVDNTEFKTAQYISPELCRNVEQTAARAYVAAALDGHAREIVCLSFPCALVWCESASTRINDPCSHDLPEYARVDKQTGAISWGLHAHLLSDEQRQHITMSATAYVPDAISM